MTRTRFFLLAALLAWFTHDGSAQVHMSAGTAAFTDSRGVAWTPNICTGWRTFPNPGSFPSPAYNTPAYTATAGVPIACSFALPDNGPYRILLHLIEAVRTFTAPQRRVFDIYINGDAALMNVDPFARAGMVEAPVDVELIASPVDGVITVSFIPQKSSAMFAGIELLSMHSDVGAKTMPSPNNEISGKPTYAYAVPAPANTLVRVTGLGDSMTQADIASGVTSYLTQLQAIAGVNTYMLALTGYTSTQIKDMLRAAPTVRAGDLVIVWACRNDIAKDIADGTIPEAVTVATCMDNLKTIARTVEAAGGRLLVLTPVNANGNADEYYPGGSHLNYFADVEAAIAKAFPNNYLDIWQLIWQQACAGGEAFGLPGSDLSCPQHTPPMVWVSAGVHLNTTAYNFVARKVAGWMGTHGGQYLVNATTLARAIYESGAMGRTHVAAGTDNAMTVTTTPPPPQISATSMPDDGTMFCATPAVTNTGPATIAFNGGVYLPVVKARGADLAPGDWTTTAKACFIYRQISATAGEWELQNPQTSSGN